MAMVGTFVLRFDGSPVSVFSKGVLDRCTDVGDDVLIVGLDKSVAEQRE